jgi:hypothetical protein
MMPVIRAAECSAKPSLIVSIGFHIYRKRHPSTALFAMQA